MTLDNLSLALYLNNIEIIKRLDKLKQDINAGNAQNFTDVNDKINNINNKIQEIIESLDSTNNVLKTHIESADIHVNASIKNIISKLSVNDGRLFYNGAEIGSSDTKKFTSVIRGNASRKAFTVTHNLGTKDVVATVKDQDGEMCFVDYIINDNNNITLNFENAPSGTAVYTVTVL